MRILLRLATATAVALGLCGCATPIIKEFTCDAAQICPIVIHKTWRGFVAYPNRMVLTGGAPSVSLIWTFTDPDRYEFDTTRPGLKDGVKWDTKQPEPISRCYVNSETKLERSQALTGAQYRCDLVTWTNFGETAYTVYFTDKKTKRQIKLDPTVATTVPFLDVLPLPTMPKAVLPVSPVLIGADATIRPHGQQGVRIVWTAPEPGRFDPVASHRVSVSDRSGNTVDLGGCGATDANGIFVDDPTPYYSCDWVDPGPINHDYRAVYRSGTVVTIQGKITRN